MSAGAKLPGAIAPMHFWRGSGGNTIAGDSWGDPAGPMVILQHGGGQTRHAWKGAGERLGAAGYFAIALDARGHGNSEWASDGRYDQDAMIGDLKCVIAALGGVKPALVGASLGGVNSLVAVGEGMIDASALVLVDIAARIEREGAERVLAFMTQKPDGFESLEEAADAIASYQPHRKRPRDMKGLVKNLRLAPSGKFRWHWDPLYSRSFCELEQRQRRYEGAARSLKVPTLVVRGGTSDVLSEEGVLHFQQLCRHAEVITIAGAGHMIAGDRNDIFVDAVVGFLRRQVLPRLGSKQK